MKTRLTTILIIAVIVLTAAFIGYRAYARSRGLMMPEKAIALMFRSRSAETPLQAAGSIHINYDAKGMIGSYKGMLVKCDRETVTAYDITGNERWSVPFKAVGSVLMRTAGSYLLIADIGGKQLLVMSGSEEKLRTQLPFNIKNADISTTGKFLVVHDDVNNNNAISVYDLNERKTFTRYFVENTIVTAHFTHSGKSVLVYGVNISEMMLDSVLEFVNMAGETEGSPVHMSDTLFSAVETMRSGDSAAISDSVLAFFGKDGEAGATTLDLGKNNILCYDIWSDSSLLIAVRNQTGTAVRVVSGSGRTRSEFNYDDQVAIIAAGGGTVAMANGSGLTVTNEAGRVIIKGNLNSDITRLVYISSDVLAAVTGKSIEFFRI